MANQHSNEDIQAAAMRAAIAAQKKTDPLVGVKIGSREVLHRMMNAFKNERGVHIESILSAMGAVAGYACQASIREEFVSSGKMVEGQAFAIATTTNGRKYFFGDMLNKPLAEDQYSIWSLVAGVLEHLKKPLPDVMGIFKHVSATVGHDNFGVPRIPPNHQPGDLPINFVKVFWPKILQTMQPFCDKPSEWPMLLGLSIQQLIMDGKDVIDPTLAATIVMESAVPMSKIDLTA